MSSTEQCIDNMVDADIDDIELAEEVSNETLIHATTDDTSYNYEEISRDAIASYCCEECEGLEAFYIKQ